VPNLIGYPNSVGLNVSHEVQNVSALHHSCKSGQDSLVILSPQLLGRQSLYLSVNGQQAPKAQLLYWGVPNPSALPEGKGNR